MRDWGATILLVAASILVSGCDDIGQHSYSTQISPFDADPYSAQSYSIRAVYFDAMRFRTTADCLTHAYSSRVPLEVCTMPTAPIAGSRPGRALLAAARGN